MSKKKGNLFFFLLVIVFFAGCVQKREINLDLSDTPKSIEEVEAEKFADKASYDMSSYFLKKAVKDYSSKGNWEKVIQNYIRLGNNYRLEGNYDLALKYLNMGLEVALTHSAYRYSELASSYHKLAFKHLRDRNFEKALDLYQKALAVRIAAFGRYHKEVSRSYNSIALVYRNMGNYREADAYYFKSLLIKLRRFENIDENFFRSFKFIDSNRVKQKFYTEAKRVLGKSLKVYLETYGGSHHLSGIIYENIGIIYTLEGDFERAMENFRKALKIRTELFGENSLEVADTYHDIGTALILKNEFRRAGEFLTDSLSIKTDKLGENHLFSGDTFFQLGKLHFMEGDYDSSLRFLQDSLISLISGFDPKSVCDNPELNERLYFKKDLIKVLSLKGEAFRMRYSLKKDRIKDLKCSFSSYLKSVELVELMRNQYTPDEYNPGFESISRDIYSKVLKVSMDLHRLTGEDHYRTEAFRFSERSKAALLWGMIADSEAKEFAGIPKKLLETESMLKNEIVRLELLLERDYMSGKRVSALRREALETSYFEIRNRYQKFIESLEQKYPKYYNLKFQNWIPDISQIQKGIDKDEVILEYFMTEDTINIYLISTEKFITKEVKAGPEFKACIRDFYRSIVKIEESEFLRTSPLLYEKLIAPIGEYISDKKKITIIPDSELFLIPFEALISGSGEAISFSDLNFMVRKHSFAYHYSIVLRNSRTNGGSPGNRNFLGFAPVFKWKTKALFEPVLKKLPSLPGTAEEVRSIMEIFNSKGIGSLGYFYGDATESRFKKTIKEQEFGFIHIATHTVNNLENPVLSGLIFAGDIESDEEEDGVLFSKEIYNLKLRTSLLVLSSCESGAGKLVKGEGVLALNRGFFFSGAQNIIFSLWTVEDRSTSMLMVELYRNILEGKTFQNSLREAKLTLISDPYTAFPKYWSSFILFGN
ncbi:MAG: CHAT domain-containing protein [Candidatus Aminicenantes bacterium]|nr:CHAT domain-containing protein [Candidatus Aminicenantes bacterium]